MVPLVQLLRDDRGQVTGATTLPVAGMPRNPAWLVALGNFVFKTRDLLFPVILVSLVAFSTPHVMHGDVGLQRALDVAGVLVALAGQALRVAVIGYRYIVRGGRNRQVYAEGLVSTGFFALSRNPLYVGNLLILLGLHLIWHSIPMLVIGIPTFLLGYRAIVAAEETYLGRQYGDSYAEYCSRVPRWWPRLGGLRAATAGMDFNWPRVVIKEYGSAAYWMAGALVLLMLKQRHYAALAGAPAPDRTPWMVGVGVVAALWATARYLKKSKTLRE